MRAKVFNSLAKELFGEVLIPLGFTTQGSKRCTFYRKVGNEVFHFITPDMGLRGAWYDVLVFPHSPAIYPLFNQRFPNGMGVPTDSFSYLTENGISSQAMFNCKNEENMRRRFMNTVGPALLKVAIPYLDRFQSVSDIIPVIRHPSFLGFALNYVGRFEEAVVALKGERHRLMELGSSNKDVAVLLEEVERLLANNT